MGKLVVSNEVTLDGYFGGLNGELDWHIDDDDFNDYAVDMLNGADALIFGRRTYELMVGYWTLPAAFTDAPLIAEKMNSLPKIVFSKTLNQTDWQGTRLAKGDLASDMVAIKQEFKRDIVILGSGNLIASLMPFIDEYRILVNPTILGSGIPMFSREFSPLKLQLLSATPFRSGVVKLDYQAGG